MDYNKTIVFGLDGVCFDYIDPWIEDGSLPNLRDLIKKGGRSKLESCVPATTPSGWTSLTTGVNPGKHGIFGFYTRKKIHTIYILYLIEMYMHDVSGII